MKAPTRSKVATLPLVARPDHSWQGLVERLVVGFAPRNGGRTVDQRLATAIAALTLFVALAPVPAQAVGSTTFGSPHCTGTTALSTSANARTSSVATGCWHVAARYKTYDNIWHSYKHGMYWTVNNYAGASVVSGGHLVYIGSSTTAYYATT
jgi:hypothetical protein